MNEQKASAQESLQGLSQGDASRLGFLRDIIANSYTESGLDPQTFMLVRMAALATLRCGTRLMADEYRSQRRGWS